MSRWEVIMRARVACMQPELGLWLIDEMPANSASQLESGRNGFEIQLQSYDPPTEQQQAHKAV